MPATSPSDRGRIRMTISTDRTVRLPTPADGPPLLPWPVAALGGGALAALAGSLVVAGVVLVAWLSAIAIPLPAVLTFSAQVWLLAHGGVVPVVGDQVTLVPLGLTLAFGAICASVGGFAYRQGRLSRTGDLTGELRRRLVLGSIGQVAAGYTLFAAVLAGGVSGAAGLWRPAVGAFVVSALGASVGVALASGHRPGTTGPDWLRRALRGAAAGVLALVAGAAIVLGLALILGENRVAKLEDSLRLVSGGLFVWSLVALAYLPNLLAWALSWALGAGFTVGTGSLVSLSTTELGMLPAVPVFGALPAVGVADQWLLAWLGIGIVSGGLAGVVAVRRGRTGAVGAMVAGAAAGLLLAALHVGWAAASRGSLGSLRMVGLGPRLLESLLIGAPILLLSSLLAALVTWFVRRRGPAS